MWIRQRTLKFYIQRRNVKDMKTLTTAKLCACYKIWGLHPCHNRQDEALEVMLHHVTRRFNVAVLPELSNRMTHLNCILRRARIFQITRGCERPQPSQFAVEGLRLCFFLPKAPLDPFNIFLPDGWISAPFRVITFGVGFYAVSTFWLCLVTA
jgi:hypothetical protein